ncbi:MAG: antibiotic biosynthesis monooxygenase [Thermoanaerobaculia bacterium]|nr:antibiotic biosynthesis monooxygenase [Thermoanaerobaculia bacterium]
MTMVLLEAVCKPEKVAAMTEKLAEHLPETRAFDGCRGFHAFLAEDGKTFVLVEHWDSPAHYERYRAWRVENGTLDEIMALLEAEPQVRYFEPVDA